MERIEAVGEDRGVCKLNEVRLWRKRPGVMVRFYPSRLTKR